jgi:hypothetical protein
MILQRIEMGIPTRHQAGIVKKFLLPAGGFRLVRFQTKEGQLRLG